MPTSFDIISFQYFDVLPKIQLILYPSIGKLDNPNCNKFPFLDYLDWAKYQKVQKVYE